MVQNMRSAAVLMLALVLGACSLFPGGGEDAPGLPSPSATPTVEAAHQEVAATETPASVLAAEGQQLAGLVDSIWVLVGYGNSTDPTVVEGGVVITAEFGPNGFLSGSGGCNNYRATYELDGSQLDVGPVISTKVACEAGMDQENAFLEALQSARSYAITPEDRLEIEYGLGASYETRLIFVKGQVPLVDTTWVLQSFGDASVLTDVEAGTSVTAVFTDEGYLNGSSGCNHYSATFAANEDDGSMSFSPPISTRKLCPIGMEQEALYLDSLANVERYRVIGSRLELSYREGEGLMVFSSQHFPLENTLWTLVSLNGGPVAEDAPLTIQFSPGAELNEGQVGGVIGCNNFSTDYTASVDGELDIGRLATTFMACSPEVMQIEQSYINALETVESYQILGNQLILNSPLAVLVLAADRTPLEGTYWALASIGEASAPQPPVPGSNFTVQFVREPDAPSGNLMGTTGCKSFQSTYIASLTEMKVNRIDLLESQECSAELVQQEQKFFLGLRSASTYQIIGSMLTINFGDDAVLNFVAMPAPVDQSPDLTPLNGSFWFLTSLNDQEVLSGTVINARININADRVTGNVSGSAGCNTYNSDILEGFSIALPAATRMTCDQPSGIMEQEQLYLDMLQRARAYSISGDELLILTTMGPLSFSSLPPEPLADPAVILVDRTWFLTSINQDVVVPGYEPSAYFANDGALSGSTGCNLFSARFITDQAGITVTPIVKTEDPCDERLMAQEQAFIIALQAAVEIKVTATTLQLIGVNGVLNFTSIPPSLPQTLPTQLPGATPTATESP